MKMIRRISVVGLGLALMIVAWLWWNRPHKVDMSAYAPADTIVYLESNSLMDIAESMVNTDAWKALNPLGVKTGPQRKGYWLRRFSAWTGIGPTQGVILARAQVAMVMLDLGAREQGETITIKPQAALLIETHTSKVRMKATVEEALRRFAEQSYGQPAFKRNNLDSTEILVWTAPASERQIVAAIDGSLVIVGNSEPAVRACLEVRSGTRPSLGNDQEMQQMRLRLAKDGALAFGFVSSAHAAQLLSLGTPLLFGRSPGGLNFERLIASSAPKIIGSVGWSSRQFEGGIEDRYLFLLQATIIARLKPLFRAANGRRSAFEVVPENIHALTMYRFEDPAATWQGLQSALSSHLDTLSAILFTSFLKSALLPYGIEDPGTFLRVVGPELITARFKQDRERAILIAQIRDEPALRSILNKTIDRSAQKDELGKTERPAISDVRSTVNFVNGYVLIGSAEDVRRWSQVLRQSEVTPTKEFQKMTHFVSSSRPACVVTYTNDSDRVRNFISAIARAQGKPSIVTEPSEVHSTFEDLPFSVTETILDDQGVDRRTRSSFGQFGTLITLLFPEK